jgi:hypothetical protein
VPYNYYRRYCQISHQGSRALPTVTVQILGASYPRHRGVCRGLICDTEFVILMPLPIKNLLFGDGTPCILVYIYRPFEQRAASGSFPEHVRSFATSVHFYRSTTHYMQNNILNRTVHTHTPQVQNYAAKHRLNTRKISRVISVKHVQHSLMMDRKRSETCRSDF